MGEASKHVLIVESVAADREQYKGILAGEASSLGFSILEAPTGQQGLALCRTATPPDCVIVSQSLSDMDSSTFLNGLSSDAATAPIPVVVILGQRSRKAVNEATKSGAADWLFKDQAGAVLDRVVRYIFGRKAAESKAAEARPTATKPAEGKVAESGADDSAAAEQRMLFKAVLTNAPGFLALKNQQLQYQAVNPAFCQLVGKSPEEIVGSTDAYLFQEADAKVLRNEDGKVVRSGMPRTQLHSIATPGGQRWVEVTRTPILDVNGDPTGLLWSGRDITEFKEMEESVRRSHDFYTSLAQDQSELACQFQTNFALTSVNEPLSQFVGTPAEELLGQSFLTLLPEEEQEAMEKHLAALTSASPVAARDLGAVSASGAIAWQQWTTRALFNSNGTLAGYQAVGRDISAWKQAQDALAEQEPRLEELKKKAAGAEQTLKEKDEQVKRSDQALKEANAKCQQTESQTKDLTNRLRDGERRFADAMNLFPVPYGELGGGTRVAFFNQAALKTFGYSAAEIAAGLILEDLFALPDRERAREAMRTATEGKPVAPAEYRMRRKDGSTLTVQLICAPILSEGRPAGLRCCLVDLVDRRRVDDLLNAAGQLAGAATRAAALNQRVTELMAATLQATTQTQGAPAGPDAAKLAELQTTLDKVSESVQKMRPGDK